MEYKVWCACGARHEGKEEEENVKHTMSEVWHHDEKLLLLGESS